MALKLSKHVIEVSLMRMTYICSRCGDITYDDELKKDKILCSSCGFNMVMTKYTEDDACSVNYKEFKNKLYNEYCYSNPMFSSYQFDKRQQEDDSLYVVPKNPSGKRCPKCGNTEFTPVRKKYSLLTGFLTNKVELICNKCGTKIK